MAIHSKASIQTPKQAMSAGTESFAEEVLTYTVGGVCPAPPACRLVPPGPEELSPRTPLDDL